MSVVSLSVSPDDGSGTSSRAVEIGLFIEYLTNLLGVVCVGVELAVVFVLLGFSQQVFPLKIWVFYCWFFPLGEVGLLPLNVAVCLAPAQFLFSLLSSLVIPACCKFCGVSSVVNDDSCGVHSRPYPPSVVNNDSCGVHSRPYHELLNL